MLKIFINWTSKIEKYDSANRLGSLSTEICPKIKPKLNFCIYPNLFRAPSFTLNQGTDPPPPSGYIFTWTVTKTLALRLKNVVEK